MVCYQEIKVINSGVNYNKNDTIIDIVSPIGEFKLTSYPKSRNINLYQRLELDKFADDDNVVYRGRNSQFGLQFTHLYAPKLLRERLLYGSNLVKTLFRKDIDNDNPNIS